MSAVRRLQPGRGLLRLWLRRGSTRALRHVVKEPVDIAVADPFSPQPGALFCPPQGRQQLVVHLAGVGAGHHALYVQPVMGAGDRRIAHHLGKHRADHGQVIRTHLTGEPELRHRTVWHAVPRPFRLAWPAVLPNDRHAARQDVGCPRALPIPGQFSPLATGKVADFLRRTSVRLFDTFVLASGHWYNSALFGIAGFGVGIAGVLISVWTWRFGSPYRRLVYWIQADTALLTAPSPGLAGLPQIEVRLVGKPDLVRDPHVLSVRLENRSHPDIEPGDFANKLPLVIDVQATILEVLNREALLAEWPHLKFSAADSKISIQPTLISSRKRIAIDMLTDGPANLTHEAQLANVDVSLTTGDTAGSEAASRQTRRIMALILAASVVLAVVCGYTGPTGVSVVALLLAISVAITMLLTAVTDRIARLVRPGRSGQ